MMPRVLFTVSLVAAVTFQGHANAGSTGDMEELAKFRACAKIVTAMERHACFDRAAGLEELIRKEAEAARAAEAERIAAAKKQAAQDFGLAGTQKAASVKKRAEKMEASEDPAAREAAALAAAASEPGSVSSTVISFSRTPTGRIVVVLENGHVWVEADGSHFQRDIKPGAIVTIKKRLLAGFRLVAPGINETALVERFR